MTKYDPDPDERRPFDEQYDDDLREHGHVAVYHSNAHGGLRKECVGIIWGHGPSEGFRPRSAIAFANSIEEGDGEMPWLDAVDDPEALAEDIRDIAEKVNQ